MTNTPESLCYNAEKCMRSHGFFSSLFSRPNYDEAAELYLQAANKYKVEKQWKKASETFSLAANACQLAKNWFQQASFMVEAGHCAKKYSINGLLGLYASQIYQAAIEIYKDQGQFHQAAKLMKTIAEMNEDTNYSKSIECYKKAAEFFDMDEFGKSQRAACFVKYAELASQHLNNLNEAIEIFEEEGIRHLGNKLLQYSAKDFFFRAVLLYIVKQDISQAITALEKYKKLDSRFSLSREEKFLTSILDSIKENNAVAFTTSVQEFDQIRRLDPWHVHFLFQIKQNLDPNKAGISAISELAEKYEKDITHIEDEVMDEEEIDLS